MMEPCLDHRKLYGHMCGQLWKYSKKKLMLMPVLCVVQFIFRSKCHEFVEIITFMEILHGITFMEC